MLKEMKTQYEVIIKFNENTWIPVRFNYCFNSFYVLDSNNIKTNIEITDSRLTNPDSVV